MANETTLLAFEGLALEIQGRSLLRNFMLNVKKGTRVGLTGPSGCGKTTLLRSIARRKISSGLTAKRFEVTPCRIGYIPQRGGMLPWYSLKRNLQVFASVTKEEQDCCEKVLAFLELTHVASTFPENLSGGELQRSRLACAIITKPDLYCADEPLTEVGLQQKWRLLERWSSEIAERNAALLLVSHDVDTLLYLCDEIVILGGSSEPAEVLDRLDLSSEVHPRCPKDLNSHSFETARRRVTSTVYGLSERIS